jgi:undecaprenyl-diphosphatase
VLGTLAESILSLRGWSAVAVVFALPALESSAFVGFVFPGEIAVLLGGVLAFEGRVSLPLVLAAAILGAIVGDTIGYAVGRAWGDRILKGTLGRFVKDQHLERAKSYLAGKGGKAVLVGRFTAALRVMIPGLAGMSGVPYRTFAIANVIGGTIWATTFVLLGYAAGESWRKVEQTAKQAGLVIVLAVVVAAAAYLTARWVIRNPDRVRRFLDRQTASPSIQRLLRRYERQFAFVARRARPEGAFGLSLTAGLLGIGVLGTLFGRILRGVVANDSLTGIDDRVHRFLLDHHEPFLTSAMRAVTTLGSTAVLVPLVIVLGGGWWLRRRDPRPLALLAGALGGAYLLARLVAGVVARPRPPVAGDLPGAVGAAFPSGHATLAFAVFFAGAVCVAATSSRWATKVTAWTAAVLITAAVGVSRLYLEAHWLTDVLGGFALAGLWLVVLLTAARMLGRPPPQPRRSAERVMAVAPRK